MTNADNALAMYWRPKTSVCWFTLEGKWHIADFDTAQEANRLAESLNHGGNIAFAYTIDPHLLNSILQNWVRSDPAFKVTSWSDYRQGNKSISAMTGRILPIGRGKKKAE